MGFCLHLDPHFNKLLIKKFMIKVPFIFRFPFSYNFKRRLFFRFFYPLKDIYYPLFENVRIKSTPCASLKLVPTDFMHGLMAFTGIYEETLTNQIVAKAKAKAKAKESSLFIDVGANAGYFSIIWAFHNPFGRVYAFEASPRNVNILEQNISRNHLHEQVRIFPIALGRESAELPFDCGPSDLTGWGGIVKKKTGSSISVKVESLDSLIRLNEVVDVLKIDVEGADTWVLMGAKNLLMSKRIKTIYFEQNKTRLGMLGIREDEAINFLKSVGYRVYALSNTASDIVDWAAVPDGEGEN